MNISSKKQLFTLNIKVYAFVFFECHESVIDLTIQLNPDIENVTEIHSKSYILFINQNYSNKKIYLEIQKI